MTPCRIRLLGALLLGALAPAQQDAEQRPPAQPAKQEYEALTKAYGQAQQAYVEKYKAEADKAKANNEPAPAFDMSGLVAEWTPRFQEGARKYKGSDGAIRFLLWLAGNAKDEDHQAIDTLIADHLKSPEFVEGTAAIGRMSRQLGAERVHQLLEEILAKNPNGDVQAQARLSRATLALDSIRTAARKGEPLGDAEQAKIRTDAISELKQGIAKVQDDKLKGRLEGSLYEQEHLQPGMPAPDIVGEDLDGKPFRLSDYKGKVVLLDFWGDW